MKIVLGITGSAAAHKAAELARILVRADASVHPVMTRAATELLGPKLMHALTGNRPVTDLFDDPSPYAHIELIENASAVVVAPATANIIGKAAAGIADDALSTVIAAASRLPVVFAPAMNVRMYEHAANARNMVSLEALGYTVIHPEAGSLACGDEGYGRLAPVEFIFEEVMRVAWPAKDLFRRKILVTGGGTREPLDPVRYLGNPSSGKMGCELARAAARRGAAVNLVTAAQNGVYLPSTVTVVRVNKAEEMLAAVRELAPGADAVIMSAAVADFRPAEYNAEKFKKGEMADAIKLAQNTDILAELGSAKGDRILVGFAAETGDLETEGRRKMAEKNLDMMIANRVGGEPGFGSEMINALIVGPGEEKTPVGIVTKAELAGIVLDRVVKLLGE
jgi:phosphopantothenoylcysteine decarboxylase/phosphopantothenate--cysteine ligase